MGLRRLESWRICIGRLLWVGRGSAAACCSRAQTKHGRHGESAVWATRWKRVCAKEDRALNAASGTWSSRRGPSPSLLQEARSCACRFESGYRPGPHGVDTLLVGVYDGKALQFAGKVRGGFTPPVRRAVATVLTPLHAARCPLVDLPTRTALRWGGGVTAAQMPRHAVGAADRCGADPVREWTDDAHLRHAAFVGLRTDRAARDVRREFRTTGGPGSSRMPHG